LEDPTTLETSALDYLEPLFTGDVCSYRIESYWTYEICHGNYIKQYHEERDGKTSKMQVGINYLKVMNVHHSNVFLILGILPWEMEQRYDS
jgi:Glucosidase II beta subunit-like protein